MKKTIPIIGIVFLIAIFIAFAEEQYYVFIEFNGKKITSPEIRIEPDKDYSLYAYGSPDLDTLVAHVENSDIKQTTDKPQDGINIKINLPSGKYTFEVIGKKSDTIVASSSVFIVVDGNQKPGLPGYKKELINQLSREYGNFIIRASEKFNVDACLILGTMAQESNGDPNAISPKGSAGLMQFSSIGAKDTRIGFKENGIWNPEDITPCCTAEEAKRGCCAASECRDCPATDPRFDPRKSILAATLKIKHNLKLFCNDERLATAAYNSGESCMALCKESGKCLSWEDCINKISEQNIGFGECTGNNFENFKKFSIDYSKKVIAYTEYCRELREEGLFGMDPIYIKCIGSSKSQAPVNLPFQDILLIFTNKDIDSSIYNKDIQNKGKYKAVLIANPKEKVINAYFSKEYSYLKRILDDYQMALDNNFCSGVYDFLEQIAENGMDKEPRISINLLLIPVSERDDNVLSKAKEYVEESFKTYLFDVKCIKINVIIPENRKYGEKWNNNGFCEVKTINDYDVIGYTGKIVADPSTALDDIAECAREYASKNTLSFEIAIGVAPYYVLPFYSKATPPLNPVMRDFFFEANNPNKGIFNMAGPDYEITLKIMRVITGMIGGGIMDKELTEKQKEIFQKVFCK